MKITKNMKLQGHFQKTNKKMMEVMKQQRVNETKALIVQILDNHKVESDDYI